MANRTHIVSHITAALASLYFAWSVSQTDYVQSAIQFVAPLLLILLVHTGAIALSNGLKIGFAQQVFGRSACTAIGMIAVFFVVSMVAPKPAMAANAAMQDFLMVVFCLLVLLFVVGVAALILLAVFRVLRGAWNLFRKVTDSGPETRLFDFASLGLVSTFLVVASLEGHPNYYTYESGNEAVVTRLIAAEPHVVWAVMENATSVDYPLPNILGAFPQPVSVILDEGMSKGAKRQVQFQGRQGAGVLSLEVVKRTNEKAVFVVVGDTSPFARWIGFQTLTYRVTTLAEITKLDVSLAFQRDLAPSWFFTPVMNGAAGLAMDVLAMDVKTRAERFAEAHN